MLHNFILLRKLIFYIFLLRNKYIKLEMVQCYSCHANLSGNWNIKLENGYNNGAYLGLDCYFAYPGVNWVYCFCQACFNNGNFANNIKTWYAAPIKSIIDA